MSNTNYEGLGTQAERLAHAEDNISGLLMRIGALETLIPELIHESNRVDPGKPNPDFDVNEWFASCYKSDS